MGHRSTFDRRSAVDRTHATIALVLGLVMFSGIGIGLLIAAARS